MCGRYNIVKTSSMDTWFKNMGIDGSLQDQYNIAPTETVPIIFENQGKRECHLARWWLTPSWSSGPDTKFSMFNARSETLETSRAFKGPYRHKRCVLPASSFIEWQKTADGKQAIEIFSADDKPIVMAGLWDCWNEELISCTIVTTKAAPSIEAIHSRMPVMLDDESTNRWLDMSCSTDELKDLFTSELHVPLHARKVHKSIGNSRLKEQPQAIGDGWSLN